MKKIIVFVLVLVFSNNLFAQIDDCVKKTHSNWGAGCKGCATNDEDAFEVILQNICTKKIDIVIAVQETNKHWMRFEKTGVTSKDTMRSFVCKGTSKFQYWFKETGDASLLPSYEEINKDYYAQNPHLKKQTKPTVTFTIETLALKLLLGDAKRTPLVNQTVYYRNSDGIKQTTITNIDGDFIMNKLNGEKSLEIELEKNSALDANTKIILADRNGTTINEIKKGTDGGFKYTMLPQDLITISKIEFNEELALKRKEASLDNVADFANSNEKELKVKRQVTYTSGSAELSDDAKKELDGIAKLLNDNTNLQLEIIAHTDARGDDATNLALSEKRAKNSMNYLITKGIKTERLKSKGMGETEILNLCKNNITCTEQEHAVNRRTEFIFVKK